MEKTKPVHQLDTPFSVVKWPTISQDDQDSILDLLCNLLSPIGHHRKAHVRTSKGKRSKAKKRKRDQENGAQPDLPVPPAPVVAASIDVGLSSITRNLQLGTARPSTPGGRPGDPSDPPAGPVPYSVIFVARSGPSSAFFNHLPQMIAAASRAQHLAEPIRLVGISRACEERLSACMGVPRVTSVAIRGADGTAQLKALVRFVRERVPAVEAPWLEEVGKGTYIETKINTIQAPIGPKRQKKER